MAPRRYEQRLRAEQAEETRRRVLDAVAGRLREAPGQAVGLDDIARRAGVARSTIYQVFGSRSGLFEAFAQDLWARSGLADLTEAVAASDARDHLRGGIAAGANMFAAERDLYRVLFSMAQLDAGPIGDIVAAMEEDRRGGMAHLAGRLAEEGALRADVSVEEATDILWVLCSFESFDLLHHGRGLALDRSVELLVAAAERAVCADVPAGERPAS